MGLLDIFSIKKSATYDGMSDDDDRESSSQHLAFKFSALDKCVNYVARTISKSQFLIKSEKSSYEDWFYWLNVRPNPNQSAPEFWKQLIQNLIKEGEALIFREGQGLYVAENFSKEEKNLKGDIFKVSRVQGQSFEKLIKAKDVIYLTYENDGLDNHISQLWEDYGILIGRLINSQKVANQIRFTFDLPMDKIRERQQEMSNGKTEHSQGDFFKRLVRRMKNDPVVPIPIKKDAKYEEFKGQGSTKVSFVDDIDKIKKQYVADVAEIIGIAPSLIHGEVADNSTNYRQFIEQVIEPLVSQICRGLEYAIFEKSDYINGDRVKVTGLKNYDLFDVSSSADKLIADGIVNADEIREELGLPPIPDGKGQIYYMTKNYEELGKKGDTTNETIED